MKKRILLYVLLAVVVIISGSLFIHYNRVQNVFDEMYYSWDRKNLFVMTDLRNVEALKNERLHGYIYPGDNVTTNVLKILYDEDVLENNTSVMLNIYPDDKDFQVLCSAKFVEGNNKEAEEDIFMIFTYDVKTKTMLLEPINVMSDSLAKKYPDKFDYYEYYDDIEHITMFMEEHGITKEEIEVYRDYFIDEVLIGMWVDGNDEESRYDRYDAGKFKIEDELFANFE